MCSGVGAYSLSELSAKYVRKQVQPEDGTPLFSCTICGRTFRDNTGAKYHLEALHFPTGGYDCRLCGKHLSTKNSLKCHMYQVHSREERQALKY